MAITNYGELKVAVANWLQKEDLLQRIPEFIALAEDRIAQDERIRIRAMETSAQLTVNAQLVALPAGYLEARRFYLEGSPKKRLELLAPEDFWIRNLANQTSTPKFFTIEGENLVFGPAPDTTYTGEFLYFQRFTALSADADTNWLLTNARGLLLYGALLEAALLAPDDPRTQEWALAYDNEARRVRGANRRDRYSGAPLVTRSDVQVY